MLVAPKPSRLLVEERSLLDDGSHDARSVAVKQKKSFKRLSDMLKGGDSDRWVVYVWLIDFVDSRRFSDVSLVCARTGVTTLPPTGGYIRSSSTQDLGGRGKFATTGRRSSSQIKPRNLYKVSRSACVADCSLSGWRHGTLSRRLRLLRLCEYLQVNLC